MEQLKTHHRRRHAIRKKLKLAPVVAFLVVQRITERLTNAYQKTFVSPEETTVDLYKEQGFSWFQVGEFVKARDAFFHYLDHVQDRDPGVLYMLAMCYKNMDEDEEAVAFLKKAEQTAKNDPDVIKALGECLFNIEEYPEAIVFLTKAARISPWDAGIQYRLGISHEKLKQPAEAEAFYKKAIALDPSRIEYYQTLGFLHKGSDRHKDAIAVLRQAFDAELRRKRAAR